MIISEGVNMEMYIKKDNQVLKVTSICMCDECRKRGMPELFLEDMNGLYFDCVKLSDLFNDDYHLQRKPNILDHVVYPISDQKERIYEMDNQSDIVQVLLEDSIPDDSFQKVDIYIKEENGKKIICLVKNQLEEKNEIK